MIRQIDITWDDIREGDRQVHLCPVALALQRETGDPWMVGDFSESSEEPCLEPPVEPYYFAYLACGQRPVRRLRLPAEVQRFLRDFDGWRSVEPFRFMVEVGP